MSFFFSWEVGIKLVTLRSTLYISRLCVHCHICTNSSIWHLTRCFWSTLWYFSWCFECPKHSSLALTSTCDQWNAHLPRALIYPNKLVREMSPFHVNLTKEWYIYIWALKSPLNGIILSTRMYELHWGHILCKRQHINSGRNLLINRSL